MRYAAIALLLTAAPVAAQVDDEFPLETRILLAGLAAADEAVGVYEEAFAHLDSAAVDAEAIRFLRQRGFEGATGAAQASFLLEVGGALRNEPAGDPEAPLTDDEIELMTLLTQLQVIGGDLVELDACEGDALPLDVGALAAGVQPTFERIRELVVLLQAGVEGMGEELEESQEDRP